MNKMTMTSGDPFPAADVEKELHPDTNKGFEVDSVSSAVEAAKQDKEEQRELGERQEQERKDALQSFKKAMIVSGIVVAVAGAVFAITKKIREKSIIHFFRLDLMWK